MSIKYGPVICNPCSEEAKELVGKEIIGGWSYAPLAETPDDYMVTTLLKIGRCKDPFEVDGSKFTFIREVIEEKPKYRPYKDTEEMVEDYKKRFCSNTTIPQYAMPLIWVKRNETEYTYLVCNLEGHRVRFGGTFYSIPLLFTGFTYLDGSPVGKEV